MISMKVILISIAVYCGIKGVYLLFVKPFKKGDDK